MEVMRKVGEPEIAFQQQKVSKWQFCYHYYEDKAVEMYG